MVDPAALERSPLLIVFAVLLVLLGVLVTLIVRRQLLLLRGSRVNKRGHRAERRAAVLLEREGFRVIDYDPRLQSRLLINGEPRIFTITPDFLVERDQVTYVVEVKWDDAGINKAAIRRQVLEYLVAADLPCLVVTMPEGMIDLVELDS